MSVSLERAIRLRLRYSPWACVICPARFFTAQDAELHFSPELRRHPEAASAQFTEILDMDKERLLMDELRRKDQIHIHTSRITTQSPDCSAVGTSFLDYRSQDGSLSADQVTFTDTDAAENDVSKAEMKSEEFGVEDSPLDDGADVSASSDHVSASKYDVFTSKDVVASQHEGPTTLPPDFADRFTPPPPPPTEEEAEASVFGPQSFSVSVEEATASCSLLKALTDAQIRAPLEEDFAALLRSRYDSDPPWSRNWAVERDEAVWVACPGLPEARLLAANADLRAVDKVPTGRAVKFFRRGLTYIISLTPATRLDLQIGSSSLRSWDWLGRTTPNGRYTRHFAVHRGPGGARSRIARHDPGRPTDAAYVVSKRAKIFTCGVRRSLYWASAVGVGEAVPTLAVVTLDWAEAWAPGEAMRDLAIPDGPTAKPMRNSQLVKYAGLARQLTPAQMSAASAGDAVAVPSASQMRRLRRAHILTGAAQRRSRGRKRSAEDV